jgi:hypothetical protein
MSKTQRSQYKRAKIFILYKYTNKVPSKLSNNHTSIAKY